MNTAGEIFDKLLDALDQVLNANSFVVTMNKDKNENFLTSLKQSRNDGTLAKALYSEDARRDWYNFYTLKDVTDGHLTYVPRRGVFFNEESQWEMRALDIPEVEDVLTGILTGKGSYLKKNERMSHFEKGVSQKLVDSFIKALHGEVKNFTAFEWKPDFLLSFYDHEEDDNVLPYFEGLGRDLALLFVGETKIILLLSNGY